MSLTIKSPSTKTIKFPVARRSVASGMVVLFTGNTRGMVLVKGTTWDVGGRRDDWHHCNDTEHWESVDVVIEG